MQFSYSYTGNQGNGQSYTRPYRFGFNGKEKDSEGMGGGLSTYDYGFRIYNPALARFLSVDPLTRSYPGLTPYQFASNGPIEAIDLDGLERYHYTRSLNENGDVELTLIGSEDIIDKVWVWKTYTVYGFTFTVPETEEVRNQRQEHVVHDTRTGYIDGADGGLGGPKEVQYEVTTTYKTTDDALNYKNGEEDWATFWFHLAQGASFAHNENKANGGIGGLIPGLNGSKVKYTVAPAKFKYFFGEVVEGTEHNIVRSAQNKKDLATLGITTETQLTAIFDKAADVAEGTVKITKYGTTVTKNVKVGDKGSIDVSFFYDIKTPTAAPKVTTIIPKIAKKQ